MARTEKTRIFLDIDGTLAKWTMVDTFEQLLQPGFYANLEPNQSVVDAAHILCSQYDDIEVFTLSAYLEEHPCPVTEKNLWLDKMGFGPVIDEAHRIFCPCDTDKRKAVPGGIRSTDLLVDDYTVNLKAWAASAKAIKLINGVNATKGTWIGPRVIMAQPPEAIAEQIHQHVMGGDLR